MATEVVHDVRSIAMAAQAHINRHEIDCGKRWEESRRAFNDLAAQVEKINGSLRSAQAFLLKGALWIIGILATALGGIALYIFNHLNVLVGH